MTAQMQRPVSWLDGGDSHDVCGQPFDDEVNEAITLAIRYHVGRAPVAPVAPRRDRYRGPCSYRGIAVMLVLIAAVGLILVGA